MDWAQIPPLGWCSTWLTSCASNCMMQLEAAAMFEQGGCARRLEHLTAGASIVPIVPSLAAVHGLGTGGYNLYLIFGFDHLHVRSILREPSPFLF